MQGRTSATARQFGLTTVLVMMSFSLRGFKRSELFGSVQMSARLSLQMLQVVIMWMMCKSKHRME